MIILKEQFGYNDRDKADLQDLSAVTTMPLSGEKLFLKRREDGLCYKFWKESGLETYRFQTSYFVGVDWIAEGEKAIYIEPKQNHESEQIDYLKMLMDALEEESNSKHLDELFEVDFNKQFIKIEQSQDLLTPLLIYQYLSLLKKIVRKGLRKSYYKVDHNLNARVKGKVLMNQTIRQNLVKSKNTSTVCRFEEFGINSLENKVLKKAFEYSKAVLSSIKIIEDQKIASICSFIDPAFQLIDQEVNILELKHIKPNPLFPDYIQALKLAKIILQKYGYSISKTSEKQIETPPFWIDMSKLFELYVFSKLRKLFPNQGEVTYHKIFNRWEPDFVIDANLNGEKYKIVVDAKYKPRYKDKSIDIDDIRQVSGYARLKSIYKFLKLENMSEVIDCLIIYSDQSIQKDKFDLVDLRSDESLYYTNFYKIGISLPCIKINEVNV